MNIAANWVEKERQANSIELSQALSIPEGFANFLCNRGIDTPEKAQKFLQPSLQNMRDPNGLAGLEKAVERIQFAIEHGETVGIFGDYDVDGVTSTTLLWDFLEGLGVTVSATIPNRLLEGYGLSRAGVDRLKAAGSKLIITVDCGITAHEEVAYATSLGLDVLVVDHHTATADLPEAVSVINPHRLDCTHGSEHLCAVGVVFNLCVALRRTLREQGFFNHKPEPNLSDLLDVVALGTVADVVPLVDENRLFVHYGLQAIRKNLRPGMRALLDVAELKTALSASTLGFQLGPRLNAAGRLDDAMAGVRLLRSKNYAAAKSLAFELDQKNKERRDIEKQIVEAAIEEIENSPFHQKAKVLVVHHENWHPGVVGIVASRLVDRFAKPTIVLGAEGKGSGRSIPAFHLHNGLTQISDALEGFGGHAHAVGVHLGAKSFDSFREQFVEYADTVLTDADLQKTYFHDGVMPIGDVSMDLLTYFQKAKPFGRGNAEPVFRFNSLQFSGLKPLKGGHLRGKTVSRHPMDFIAFGVEEKRALFDGVADILATPEINEWNGFSRLQLRVKDIRAAM